MGIMMRKIVKFRKKEQLLKYVYSFIRIRPFESELAG
jgi:hypothetical protein